MWKGVPGTFARSRVRGAFGEALAIGDFDRDARLDLAIGVPPDSVSASWTRIPVAARWSRARMKLAAYELLHRIADRAGNSPVCELAVRIGAEERAMADHVGERWESAALASLREKRAEDLREELIKYLRDAHALEAQGDTAAGDGPEDRGPGGAARGLRRPSRADARSISA